MQYLTISQDTTLSELSSRVGNRNVETFLAINQLERSPNIGQQFFSKVRDTIHSNNPVTWQRKSTILNKFSGDSDIFEEAALLDNENWKTLDAFETFPDKLKVPETITLPSSADIIGNGIGVDDVVYRNTMSLLSSYPHVVDPGIFNQYSTIQNAQITKQVNSSSSTISWFNIPWGDITLYSSLAGSGVDIPVYPEEIEDSIKANYTTMPDLLYQYEPWYVYESSGPRSNTYTFHMHRDMWTGDHRDGKANELIRFCEAACYPEYNGSAVYSDIVTLYVKGSALITGILTGVNVKWSGPIGLDGFYLEFELSLDITEISTQALSNSVMRRKSLIE